MQELLNFSTLIDPLPLTQEVKVPTKKLVSRPDLGVYLLVDQRHQPPADAVVGGELLERENLLNSVN